MGLSVLKISHARLFKNKTSDAERCPTVFHISFIQHDGALTCEDKFTHHSRHILRKDLKPEEIHQLVVLKVFDQFFEEHGVDAIQTSCWPLAILVRLQFAGGCQLENVAMDLRQVDICDTSGLGPAPPNRFEGHPQHDFAFVDLEVPVDQMKTKYFMDLETFKEAGKLLEVNFLHLWLISIIR